MGDVLLTRVDQVFPVGPVVLRPAWSMEEQSAREFSALPGLSGTLAVVEWRRNRVVRVPLAFVNPVEAARIVQWWREGAALVFTMDTSIPRTSLACRIAGNHPPLSLRVRAPGEWWAGMLVLESVDDGPRIGRPFILDDAVFGRLDQSILSLVP